MIKTSIALAGLIFLTGCATGFNRQGIQQRLDDQPIEVTDAAIKAALEKKSQIRFPIKLAVHMVSETYLPDYQGPYRYRPNDWRWSVAEKEVVDQWAETLRENGIISEMFVMSEMIATSEDLKSIRLAAAKHGADAVLLVKGVAQVDNYVNASAIFNLLILPGFVVPASHSDVLLMVRGAMWDVGNEFLYLSVDAEGEGKIKGPTFLIKEDEAIEVAKKESLKNFGKEFVKRMKALKNSSEK